MENPRMLSVTLTDADTNYQLSVLLTTADSEFGGRAYQICQKLVLQGAVGAGGSIFRAGNSDLSDIFNGSEFLSGQSIPWDSGSNMGVIDLAQIYVRCTIAAQRLNVQVLLA